LDLWIYRGTGSHIGCLVFCNLPISISNVTFLVTTTSRHLIWLTRDKNTRAPSPIIFIAISTWFCSQRLWLLSRIWNTWTVLNSNKGGIELSLKESMSTSIWVNKRVKGLAKRISFTVLYNLLNGVESWLHNSQSTSITIFKSLASSFTAWTLYIGSLLIVFNRSWRWEKSLRWIQFVWINSDDQRFDYDDEDDDNLMWIDFRLWFSLKRKKFVRRLSPR